MRARRATRTHVRARRATRTMDVGLFFSVKTELQTRYRSARLAVAMLGYAPTAAVNSKPTQCTIDVLLCEQISTREFDETGFPLESIEKGWLQLTIRYCKQAPCEGGVSGGRRAKGACLEQGLTPGSHFRVSFQGFTSGSHSRIRTVLDSR